MPCFQSFPVSYYARFYSNSTITNQFCLDIIYCHVRFSFNYLIYPYYPAYTANVINLLSVLITLTP